MKLSLGISPCPNDTFIFDALVHHKIDTEGLEFDLIFADVEALNQKAFSEELDITKLSFYAYLNVLNNYVLLNAGSALGFGVGPLLVSKKELSLSDLQAQPDLCVGIPGKHTTANFLLGMIAPQLQNKREMIFSAIEQSLLDDEIDLGLIIHENRFTYQSKGLKKVVDLGEYWESFSACAIPLGGIAIRRDFPMSLQQKVNRVIHRSVQFAFDNPEASLAWVQSKAQEMSPEVIKKHIELYVNTYSLDLGEKGHRAIEFFAEQAARYELTSVSDKALFLTF